MGEGGGPPPTCIFPRKEGGSHEVASLKRKSISPPRIDRGGLLVVAAHNPPVTVGFAAHYHHVDVVVMEHRDQFLRQSLELRGPRLLPKGRPRVDVVLDELV